MLYTGDGMDSSVRILVSGGAGYIGSHAAYVLKRSGYEPVVVDNLSSGNAWAASFGAFEQGAVEDCDFVRNVCERHSPAAALHFAAGHGADAREQSARFLKTLNSCGVKKVVFSSTAHVYGDTSTVYSGAGGNGLITELYPTRPACALGKTNLETEAYLRMMDADGVKSVSLRYFNAAGAAPVEAQIGEAHAPECHMIPRLILPLLGTPPEILAALGVQVGFIVYGDDYLTPDGSAVRDFLHVMDVAEAHVLAVDYLLKGGETDIFNLGSGTGYSILEIIAAARKTLDKPNFSPGFATKREGEPAFLIASNDKAARVLGWRPARKLPEIIGDAAAWHLSPMFLDAIRTKLGIGQ